VSNDEDGPPALAEGVVLASIGQRAVGKVIDSFLLALVILPFAFRSFQKVIEDPQDRALPLWITAAAAVTALVYDWAFIAWRGQTVGGMVMRIRAVSFDGEKVGFSAAGIRALVPTAVQLVPWGLGGIMSLAVYLWAVFDANRQGLMDKAAGTLVVQAPRTKPTSKIA
jgi:uncharacterized RDD family membrane protein YckC